MKLTLGAKYQRIVDKKRSYVLRITKIVTDDEGKQTAYLLDEKNNLTLKKTEQELKDNFILIVPDSMMNIMYTKEEQPGKDVPLFDLYVCVNKSDEVNKGNNEPSIVARQNMYSVSKNFMGTSGNKYYVGDCFNTKTLPTSYHKMSDLFEFTSIEKSWQVCMYLDDDLSVLKYLGEQKHEINDLLSKIKKLYSNEYTYGYDDNIKDFLVNNSFMDHFRYIFNILPLDFTIDIKTNRNEDGDIILNEKQKHKFEDIICKRITDVIVIPYDKDLDVSKIVSYTHMIVSDDTGSIYLIAYVVVSSYAVDQDILARLNLSK